jgi:hypothetical protein
VAQISISTIGPSQVEQSKGQLFRSPLSMPLQAQNVAVALALTPSKQDGFIAIGEKINE